MDLLLGHIETSSQLLHLLSGSSNSSSQNQFIALSSSFLSSQVIEHSSVELFSHICDILSRKPAAYPHASTAYSEFRAHKKEKQAFKNRLTTDLCLRFLATQTDELLASIPVYYVDRLSIPYPPDNHWVYETDDIGHQWRHDLEFGKQPDARISRKPLHKLDFSKLQYNLDVRSNAIFRDSQTGELVGLVYRNFIGRQDILDWAGRVIDESISMKKSVRLEDSGLITLEGYTAGSRTCSQFGWARNLKGQLDSQMIQSQRYRASSLFALLWNVISRAIPSEVIADLDTFLEANPIFRMDAGSEGKAAMRFSIQLGNHELDFFGRQLAPPSGAIGYNYSRHIHTERSPNRYVISWNNRRDLGEEHGGNFYYAGYGIRVAGSGDMLFVHEPKVSHGTGLPSRIPSPEGVPYFTSGLSIILSSRLSDAWKKYCDGKINSGEFDLVLGDELEDGDAIQNEKRRESWNINS